MRTAAAVTLAVLCAVAAPATQEAPPNPSTARILALWEEGVAARDSSDYAGYQKAMEQILELEPGHPAVMRHLARALALEGRDKQALEWLEKVARSGADLDLDQDEHLETLRDTPEFADVLATVAAGQRPLRAAAVAFQLNESDLLPEGIAYDPVDDVFYLGSVRRRSILRIRRDGLYEEFAAPREDTFYGVLGLRVDAQRRHLWAATAEMAGMKGFDPDATPRAGIYCFDTATGEALRRFPIAAADGGRNVNDLVVTSAGDVYATGAISGALFTIASGGDTVATVLPPGTLYGPNGLALSRDESVLYIAQYGLGIVKMEIATGDVDILGHGEEINVVGIDGLYHYGNGLVAIQNYLGMAQVTHFRLSSDGDFIEAARVLERHDRHFHDPTTGAIAEGRIYVVANSQLPRVDRDGTVPPRGEFDPTYILEIPLP